MGKQKKPKNRKGIQKCLQVMQHILLAAAAVSVLIMAVSSTVVIDGINGRSTYSMREDSSLVMIEGKDDGSIYDMGTEQAKTGYEDSALFNTLYGRSIADVIRMGVIRSQLETEGRYNGEKVIDVTAYNYREAGIPERYITARYYLDDLLKWSQYGYEYTELSSSQAAQFLNDKTMVTVVDSNSQYYNTSDATYLKSNVGDYTFTNDVSANLLPQTDGDNAGTTVITEADFVEEDNGESVNIEEEVVYPIMINRYKTVDGKNIEEYTADWENYNALCENVRKAADSLAYNYAEYQKYLEYYAEENSNVRYYIERTVGGHTERFTNIEGVYTEEIMEELRLQEAVSDKTAVSDFFMEYMTNEYGKNMGRYLYYSPADMIYKTNSAIEEKTIRNMIQDYGYAYPDDIKIWVAVDTGYTANDSFSQGEMGFYNYRPHFWQWIGVIAVSGILYLLIVIYLTMTTGREVDEEGKVSIRLHGFDKLPTELALVLGILAAVAVLTGITVFDAVLSYSMIYTTAFKVGFGIAVFLLDMLFFFFYYSLVRRIKAKVLWKNSYLKRLIHKLSVLAWEVYDNGSIVVRTWVPYVIFMVFNVLMFLTGIGIIVAVIVDILVGVLLYQDVKERQNIVKGIEKITAGNFSYQIEQSNLHGDNLVLAKSVNSIGNGIKDAVEVSMKDERMKADLITNVSHDLKTPLTSIINYVDLIKREEVENERVKNYIKVLDEKSQRLKQLTDDLVEASKISSGNIVLHFEKINLTELMNQTIGEFSEKFEQKNLTTVLNINAPNVVIEADSRRIWRIMENLFNNIFKYALEGTRVYIAIDALLKEQGEERVAISIKNISAMALNCNPEELTERFIRGDESRTTEGSGLGLSIAKNLTEAQNGTFAIQLDGDLFKINMTFPIYQK